MFITDARLQELRNEAYENSLIYKAKMKHFHDKNLNRRDFQVDQKVWLYNSRLKLFPGKLKPRWDGPYIIREIFSNGVVLILDPKSGMQFKVNDQRLKPYVDASLFLESRRKHHKTNCPPHSYICLYLLLYFLLFLYCFHALLCVLFSLLFFLGTFPETMIDRC